MEISSETIQKLDINRQSIQIKNYNAETQPFTFTNIPENANNFLETSPLESMETIVHSQQTYTHINETTEADFNSTLLDDGTLFSSHAVNTLIDLDTNDQQTIDNSNNTQTTTDITGNHCNHQNRHHVNSTELTQNSDPLNTALPQLPNINTPLPRLNNQNSVHFNTEPNILNNSTQPLPTNNQSFQITPQQLVDIVRQLSSQNTQQSTKAPTPYCLQKASTQKPSPVIRRNAQLMYPCLGGSVPMQQSLRPFDGTDPTYTTEDFLNAITANMVMTAGPEQTDSPYHAAWILKRIAMIQTALIGPAQQW